MVMPPRGRVALCTALVLASLTVGTASAADVNVFRVEDTVIDEDTTEFCGFEVINHFEGVVHEILVTNSSKRRTSERFLSGGPVVSTLTNTATGASVTLRNTGSILTDVRLADDEVSFDVLFVGANYVIHSEDGTLTSTGSVATRYTIRFDEAGAVTEVELSGHLQTPNLWHFYPVICVLLGATDTDGDYLPDSQGLRTEVSFGTDPLNPDTDGDGYPDGIEVANEKDPTNPDSHPRDATGQLDRDRDFLHDGEELVFWGTDPRDPDSDNDGFLDGLEVVIYGTDPNDPESHP
jgi:hypothetical protein